MYARRVRAQFSTDYPPSRMESRKVSPPPFSGKLRQRETCIHLKGFSCSANIAVKTLRKVVSDRCFRRRPLKALPTTPRGNDFVTNIVIYIVDPVNANLTF